MWTKYYKLELYTLTTYSNVLCKIISEGTILFFFLQLFDNNIFMNILWKRWYIITKKMTFLSKDYMFQPIVHEHEKVFCFILWRVTFHATYSLIKQEEEDRA